MVWHRAEHRGDYQAKRPGTVAILDYQKPWQALRIGPRPAPTPADGPVDGPVDAEPGPSDLDRSDVDDSSQDRSSPAQSLLDNAPEIAPPQLNPLTDPIGGPEPLVDITVETLPKPSPAGLDR